MLAKETGVPCSLESPCREDSNVNTQHSVIEFNKSHSSLHVCLCCFSSSGGLRQKVVIYHLVMFFSFFFL